MLDFKDLPAKDKIYYQDSSCDNRILDIHYLL
jgi:hypothetical protein